MYFCLPNGFAQPIRRINQLRNRALRRNTESEMPLTIDEIGAIVGPSRIRNQTEPLEIQVFDRSPKSFRSKKRFDPTVRFRRSASEERVEIDNADNAFNSLNRGESSRSSTVRKWASLFTTNIGRKRKSQSSSAQQ